MMRNAALADATKEINEIIWRPYQEKLFKEFELQRKNLFVCQARRLGKDYSVFKKVVDECTQRKNLRVMYFFPTIGQGVRAIFEGITNDNEGWLESLVDVEVLKKPKGGDKLYHYDNSIRFKNGSIIRIMGADKASTKVGSNENIIVFSEAAHMPKLELLLSKMGPSVAKIGGRIILVSTPNFGSYFNEMYLKGLGPSWQTSIVPYFDAFEQDGTPVYSEDEILMLRDVMSEEEFGQEMECNMEMVNGTSIYGRSFDSAVFTNEGILGKELFISADLGVADFAVFTFYRRNEQGKLRVVHHLGIDGVGSKVYSEYIMNYINANGLLKRNVTLLMPFDSINRQRGYDNVLSTFDQMKRAGWNCTLVKKTSVKDGIEITRRAIKSGDVEFLKDDSNVNYFVKKVKKYEYKSNSDGKNTYIPEHGTAGDSPSNFADSLKYGMTYFFGNKFRKDLYDKIENFEER